MKIRTINKSSTGGLTEWIAMVPLLFAIALGATLIEFHETLFPPKVASLSFWALLVVYLAAFASWFGWHEAAYRYPYTRKPIARLRAFLEAMVALSWAALLFMADQATDSLLGYLWGFFVIFGIHALVLVVRRIEWERPEAGYQPWGSHMKHSVAMLAVATAYSVWALVFSPIPTIAIWVFVFMPLAVVASYRWPQMVRELPTRVTEEYAPKVGRSA